MIEGDVQPFQIVFGIDRPTGTEFVNGLALPQRRASYHKPSITRSSITASLCRIFDSISLK